MRRKSRVDANQQAVVQACLEIGATVQHLHVVGSGCPDVLVGYRGINYLLEIKDGDKSASRTRLTPDQEHWHRLWAGQKAIVYSPSEAVDILIRGKS